MNANDPGDEGRKPPTPPPPIPNGWTKPDPAFRHPYRAPPPPRPSIWVSIGKALAVMAIGVLVLFGLLLGTCFLLVHK